MITTGRKVKARISSKQYYLSKCVMKPESLVLCFQILKRDMIFFCFNVCFFTLVLTLTFRHYSMLSPRTHYFSNKPPPPKICQLSV